MRFAFIWKEKKLMRRNELLKKPTHAQHQLVRIYLLCSAAGWVAGGSQIPTCSVHWQPLKEDFMCVSP